jgi:putative ABC transport system permease protein
MGTFQLIKRGLQHHWRSNIAVVIGVATAVAVLAGALLVGDSVRQSLRDLFANRLGRTDYLITSSNFLREQLAIDLAQDEQFAKTGFKGATPLIVLKGAVINDQNRRRASDVVVYGVDKRFWEFHGRKNLATDSPTSRDAFLSTALANELGTKGGDQVVLRLQKPTDIPAESLHGRKEDTGSTIRLTVQTTLSAELLGDFSLQPQQGDVKALFIPLALAQNELDQDRKVNTILVSDNSGANTATLQEIVQRRATLEDAGIVLRRLTDQGGFALETQSKVVGDQLAVTTQKTAGALGLKTIPVLSYLANDISSNGKSIPYSLVTALSNADFDQLATSDVAAIKSDTNAIILNDWAAKDLGLTRGDTVKLEYYRWVNDGQLQTKNAEFRLVAVVPIVGLAADRNLVPSYPGITESENVSDWDPPFPVELGRVRKHDEDYWHEYNTTPKAFIRLDQGQELWSSRFGKLTSIRINGNDGAALNQYPQKLRAALDQAATGLQVIPVRQQGLQASKGATDFGEYFLYFSFFIVVSALLLTALFFKLGIEQRLREIGTLQAVGFPASKIRRIFLGEGTFVAIIGSVLGLAGALAYGALIMFGLRTWWVDAVGTTSLSLHVSPLSLLLGLFGGVAAAIVCILLTLRKLVWSSTRSLLANSQNRNAVASGLPLNKRKPRFTRAALIGAVFTIIGALLLLSALLKLLPQVAGFFGGGMSLLIASLCFLSVWLNRRRGSITGNGLRALLAMGFRNTTYRPARTVLCVSLIASSAFIIVAVDAFRRSGAVATDRKSGTGGYPLMATSVLPIVNNPNSADGQESLNLNSGNDAALFKGLTFNSFRVRPGDDASCLNLYQPRNPQIIAPNDEFLNSNRFVFQSSLAQTDAEKTNPWLLLNQTQSDGAVPVIGDANSLTYVLHLKVGDELVLDQTGSPIKLRVVAALSDSVLQSELIMSEKNFLRVFPEEEGYRLFLIDTPAPEKATEIGTTLEERLSDFGFDVVSTPEKLASFHRVENTYLSTFQMLGGLGLILGTLGMAAVLLRNVLERRKELALLRAVGYNSTHFTLMSIAENVLILLCGLIIGTICALLSIAPVFVERGGRLPNISLGLLLLAVLLSGTIASLVATLAALKSPLLPALRAD